MENDLFKACERGNLAAVKQLVEKGDAKNDLALKRASYRGYPQVVKYLIEQGTDIHTENDYALIWASINGDLELVKYLVESGADIHARNDVALRFASCHAYLKIIKYLIEQGADIHADHDYALRYASAYGYLEVVKYLVEKGADKSAIPPDHIKTLKYLAFLDKVRNRKAVIIQRYYRKMIISSNL